MRAPVVDKTGLVGTYEYAMFYSTGSTDGQPVDPNLTEFRTALQEQPVAAMAPVGASRVPQMICEEV